MIHAIAIDDEPLPLELLEDYCGQTGFISLQQTFTKVSEAQRYLRRFPVDLLFLDIEMPKLTGIEFYKSLEKSPMVIFTTAHSQYAIDGFNLSAVDYLLKPYSYERFLEAVTKARSFYNHLNKPDTPDQHYLYVRSDYSLIQIPIDKILLIESFADYVDIHQAEKKITIRMTMKTILEKLSAHDFMRVHRSFIVSLKHIEKIRKKVIFIAGREIPISKNFEDELLKRFNP